MKNVLHEYTMWANDSLHTVINSSAILTDRQLSHVHPSTAGASPSLALQIRQDSAIETDA